MYRYLTLIRINNLVIIALTQFMAGYFLLPDGGGELVKSTPFLLLVTSTMMIAAAGYIINDYMDVKIDLVNKPQKVVVGRDISRRWAMIWHAGLNIGGVLIGASLSLKIGLIDLVCAGLLILYSMSLKKGFLAGNLVVALLSASVIILVWMLEPEMTEKYIWVYAGFAFFMSLIREIVKDMEDIRGDVRNGCRTMPIVLGIRKTKRVVTGLLIAFAVILSLCSFVVSAELGSPILFLIYVFVFILLPLGIMFLMLYKADKKIDFKRISTLSKVIMLLGIASMVFSLW